MQRQHQIDTLHTWGWQHNRKSSSLWGKYEMITQLWKNWWATFLLPATVKTTHTARGGGDRAWWFITVFTEWPKLYLNTTIGYTHWRAELIFVWQMICFTLSGTFKEKNIYLKKKRLLALERKQKKRVDVERKLDGNERCAKSQHTHSDILPLHKKTSSLHFYFNPVRPSFGPFEGSVPTHSSIFCQSLRLFPFSYLTFGSAASLTPRQKLWPHFAAMFHRQREREPESQQEREREREGGIKEITPRRNAGEVRKKKQRDGVEVLAEGENSGRQDLYSCL